MHDSMSDWVFAGFMPQDLLCSAGGEESGYLLSFFLLLLPFHLHLPQCRECLSMVACTAPSSEGAKFFGGLSLGKRSEWARASKPF